VDPLLGTVFAGKYKIIKKIGEGGMGSVYLADQEPIDRKVAIKVLLGKLAEDEVAVKRFEQEARAISRMQHPNTVTIYDYGTEGERLYIVMEFLRGKTLTQVLRQDGVLVPPRACKIMKQVCSSLGDAHAAGIIHRDLKPDNIFLTEIGGDPDWVKVLDFGVAKLADTDGGTLTQTGMIFGTPKYMSPEQAEGRPIDYRADIYALGVVLYELLVGRPPFIADTPVGLLLKHISEPAPPFSRVRPDLNIDPRIEAIVMKSLEKNPDRRQQIVGELAQELAAFERAVTGGTLMGNLSPGTGPAMVPGLPTEVVPGSAPNTALTPGGLVPPNQVPGNLSLSVPSQTREMQAGTGVRTAQQGPATIGRHPTAPMTGMNDALPTAAQGVMPFAPNNAPIANLTNAMTHGLTSPIAAQGGGVDTLGGIGGDLSHGLRRPEKTKTPLLFGGIALLAVAAGLVFFTMQRPQDEPIVMQAPDPVPVVKTEQPAAVEQPKEELPKTELVNEQVVREERDPSPAKQTKRNERAREEAPAPSRKVKLSFDSEPSGAMVFVDGKQTGQTPFHNEFPKDETLSFVFKMSGYEDETVVIPATSDRPVRARLTKLAAVEKTEEPRRETQVREQPVREKIKPRDKEIDTKVLDDKVDDLK
jgi:serine/threonine protein kinase